MEKNILHEKRAYQLSLFGAFFMAALGFAFAYLTHSEAILLDGVFSLINMLMIGLTLFVFLRILPVVNNRFQFGMAQAEPMLNLVKAILFLCAIVFAIYSATVALIQGGRTIDFGLGVWYALIASVGCFLIVAIIHRINKKNPSPMLDVEKKGWMVDGFLSSAVFFVFIVGSLLKNTQWSIYLDYVDPIMVLFISTAIVPIPVKIFKDNFFELLLSAPSVKVQAEIDEKIQEVFKNYPIDDFYIRSAKTGRYFTVWIMCLNNEHQPMSMSDYDAIRQKLYKKFDVPVSKMYIYLEITTKPKIYEFEINN